MQHPCSPALPQGPHLLFWPSLSLSLLCHQAGEGEGRQKSPLMGGLMAKAPFPAAVSSIRKTQTCCLFGNTNQESCMGRGGGVHEKQKIMGLPCAFLSSYTSTNMWSCFEVLGWGQDKHYLLLMGK